MDFETARWRGGADLPRGLGPRAGARRGSCLAATLVALTAASAAFAAESELRRDVERLASAELGGRMTGGAGERLAVEHISSRLESLGARPLPGVEGLQQPFEFSAGARDAGSTLATGGSGGDPRLWEGGENIRALSFTDEGTVRAGVVFAGYGLTVPDSQGFGYDSYATLDVEGKIVVVLRYSPEDAEGDARGALVRYSGLRYKALLAREHGALALLVVTGPRSANAGATIESMFDTALSGSGILAASIGGAVAEAIFDHVPDRSLEELQRELDSANPHVAGFEIEGLELDLAVRIERERRTGTNVLAYLPATEEPAADGWLLLGAHLDHLGQGRHGNSLARKGETGRAHLGADDNASGVAAVLEVGRRLAASARPRPVVLALWSGEELGLLGSSHFIKQETLEPESIHAYLNFDMVGRMSDNKLVLQSVGSSPVWPRLIERANVAAGFDIRMQDDPHLPTDSTTLYLAGVPTLNFFTGSHEDYHRPTDGIERINFDDMERIVGFATNLARRLNGLPERPGYETVERSASRGGSRDTVRAYTGTIPDYTTEVDGLMLSGVIEGGPADLAGMRSGDIIVTFGGREIKNIYDYTYALDAVRVGQPVTVVCLRDGRTVEVTITPTNRP